MKINLIFGPPGTGKTTRMLDILEDELQEYQPEDIAYVSFTKEGAYQGRDRAVTKFGFEEVRFPYFRTLHSLAFRQMKITRQQVITKSDYFEFSKKMGMNFTGYYTEELRHNDDRYLFFNLLHRNNPRISSNYIYDLDIVKLRFITVNYKAFKEHQNILDFTDMIEMFVEANKAIPVKVAIVDEAQDLTTLQWKMIWVAFKNCEKVYIAGDDDQAIYEWSGADVEYFLGIPGEIEILHHSYRLPDKILEYSKRITNMIQKRIEKNYESTGQSGEVTTVSDLSEIKITKDEAWMFLSRNHFFLTEVEELIRSRGLIYMKGHDLSIDQKKIDAIKLFEAARKKGSANKRELVLLRPHLKKDYNIKNPWYECFEWDSNELIYYRDIIANKTNLKTCNIRISTIHAVKGAEADNVVILMDVTRQIWDNIQKNPDSEYRVFYVGCTRAKKRLFLVQSKSPFGYKV